MYKDVVFFGRQYMDYHKNEEQLKTAIFQVRNKLLTNFQRKFNCVYFCLPRVWLGREVLYVAIKKLMNVSNIHI